MIVDPTYRIILSTERYASAPKTDQAINIPFRQSMKEIIEFDRSIDLNLVDVFDQERQSCTIFRPVTKFTILFENAFTGSTKYTPFRDNLYYTNPIKNAKSYYPSGNVPLGSTPTNQAIPWDGFPQYTEFDFIRNDNDNIGYTYPPNNHLNFKNVSASTYNWSHYISYPYTNVYNKTLFAVEPDSTINWTWVASDGIPFYIVEGSDKFMTNITFKCPVEHGLTVGEFVYMSINYNGNEMFQVSSLGDPAYGSDLYIFSLRNVGYTGTTFVTNTQGTFKRVINAANSADTVSEYYIRKHKIMTTPDCTVLSNAGFERNIYGDKTKCEIRSLTPNQRQRTSVKEGSRSYNLSFNCDVDINGLKDNQNRPVSNLYFTTMNWFKNHIL